MPPNRCCRSRIQGTSRAWRRDRGPTGRGVRSPARAARAIRRSPGGSRPSSRRSRPDEPPSSATVTTAVTWSATPRSASIRSADSVACRPWPPPRATAASESGHERLLIRAARRVRTRRGRIGHCPARGGRPARSAGWTRRGRIDCCSLAAQVAVGHAHRHAVDLGQPAPDLLADRDAAVLAAGAADGERQVALALPPVPAARPAPAAPGSGRRTRAAPSWLST